MVVRDVGEHGAVELRPGDALLDNGMGACLHENMGATRVGHVAQQGLQTEGVGRGVRGGNHAVHDAVLHGANQPGFSVEQSVQLVEQGHGGRLAIGARHSDHLHVMRGVVVEGRGHMPECACGRFDLNDRDVVRGLLRHPLAQHTRGPSLDGLIDVVVAVHRRSWNGHEHPEGLHLTGIDGNVLDGDVGGAPHLKDARVVQQIGEQFHERRS